MKIEFNNWVEMLKTVIELGKENGYEIYDESNSENLRVYKEINRSCKYNNTVFLSYENKNKTKETCFICNSWTDNLVEFVMYDGKKTHKYKACSYCCRKLESKKATKNKEYIITYNQDYGFDGCFGADVRHKREVYINKSEAIERYEALKRNLDVYDLDINEA